MAREIRKELDALEKEVESLSKDFAAVEERKHQLEVKISEPGTHDDKAIKEIMKLPQEDLAGLLLRLPHLQEAIDTRITLEKVKKEHKRLEKRLNILREEIQDLHKKWHNKERRNWGDDFDDPYYESYSNHYKELKNRFPDIDNIIRYIKKSSKDPFDDD